MKNSISRGFRREEDWTNPRPRRSENAIENALSRQKHTVCHRIKIKAMETGGASNAEKLRNLLERLITYENDVLRFMENSEVPFTSNLGERDIRMTKVQQKISGCFRSRDGSELFCRVRGYLSSCQKYGLSSSQAMTLLFDGIITRFCLKVYIYLDQIGSLQTNLERAMKAVKLVHKNLSSAYPDLHNIRLKALIAGVTSASMEHQVTVTGLGRNLQPCSKTHTKHDIKRMDRLIDNPHLWCMGKVAVDAKYHHHLQANTTRHKTVLSNIYRAMQRC